MEGHLPHLLHIIPFASLGGTEKDCLYFIEASRREYNHHIWVLGGEGIMVGQWLDAGADVRILNILNLPQREFIRTLAEYSRSTPYDGILYWSTIKLPLVRYSLRNQRCRLAVHVGNPANFRVTSMLKQMVDHVLYPSPIETHLFACSSYVLRSLVIHPYYRYFGASVSHNPVRLLKENPYVVRSIDQHTEVIIGMTARLDPIKDHQTLLIAFKKVLSSYPRARLWLVGDGALRGKLEFLTNQLGIVDRVTFWGNVEDVYQKLQQMDIFVYSTTLREGLGNALSEALACGLPCIVSDLPMMREVAGNEKTVAFFTHQDADDLATKIVEILNDSHLRMQLSQDAFNRALTAFDASRYVQDRINFLRV
ncbi:MAG: glycosyltransferase [Bacteroidales bacterium]